MLAAVLVAGCADKPEALVASAKAVAGQERSQRGGDPAQERAAEESRSRRGALPPGQVAARDGRSSPRRRRSCARPRELKVPGRPGRAAARARDACCVASYKKVDRRVRQGRSSRRREAQGRPADDARRRRSWRPGNAGGRASAFAAALQAVPGYPPALLGEARLKAGARRPGRGAWRSSTRRSPSRRTSPKAGSSRATSLRAQGQIENALAAYRKALEIRPDSAARALEDRRRC